MRSRGSVEVRLSGLLFLFIASCGVLFASDPPDSRVNPASGYIETADATWNGSDYNVRHTITRGGGLPPVVTTLASSSLDDLDPRLAIGDVGDTWVVWWREDSIDEVRTRNRTYSGGARTQPLYHAMDSVTWIRRFGSTTSQRAWDAETRRQET